MSVFRQPVDVESPPDRSRGPSAPVPAPAKPRPLEVDRDARLGELIDAVFQQCHAHLLENRRAARSLEDPEGVHQLRIAVRRSRSALQLFRRCLLRRSARDLRSELRWLGHALAPARDWDVFCVETLAEIRLALPDAPGLRRLGWEAELARWQAYERAREALDSERFAYLLLRLDRFVRGAEWRDELRPRQQRRLARPAARAAATLLDQLFGDVRILERPVGQLPPEQLHALRIRIKRLRYAMEFLEPVLPHRASRRFLRRLKSLLDELGRMNDGRVADALVSELTRRVADDDARVQLARGAGLVVGWSHRRAVEERDGIEEAWLQVAGSAPFWR